MVLLMNQLGLYHLSLFFNAYNQCWKGAKAFSRARLTANVEFSNQML